MEYSAIVVFVLTFLYFTWLT
ncbi:TPA: hypothetical protein ACOF7Y_001998, partial [Staphylococcus aureus]